ncbi:hypothetical protein [Saccharothrix syringae]|uniref:Uncharacterized protein n=1 Tax=Saccharothrix syringae TaxID=103733 RepID=A0A5Q0H327_SACSY|nr:hypothetical protein [Saccharothrix syringae]QFZ20274.1 hypothetical protein EKG83_25200 [Saccharothrix syringae]
MTSGAHDGSTVNTFSGDARDVLLARDIHGDVHLGAAPRRSRGILTHRERLAGLSRRNTNLTADRLAFVPPGDHPADPARLFAALRGRFDDRGVVLVGPAGAGKTRTCLEVAALAEAQGWRVLHLLAGEYSVEQVADAVLDGTSPALVLIDYLSDCRGLDYSDLRTWLVPTARARGVEVAVLATARPGWMLLDAADPVHAEFDVVPLRTDPAHLGAVCAALLDLEARTALAVYPRDRVERICGGRPVIAMLVAREVEELARAGKPLVAPSRAGLAGWLPGRLREDGLVVPRRKRWSDRVEPDVDVQVAAAVVAACPQPREALERIAAGVPGAPGDARRYVDALLRMGWLEDDEPNLAVVHDVVVDELLEQVLLTDDGDRVRRTVADALLAPAATDARTAGRYALNLARLVRDLAAGDRADELAAFCADWLRDHAEPVGRALLADAEAGGFALGTLLDGAPWARPALERWAELVGPWLDRYGRMPQARHVYFKALHLAPADRVADLTDGAVGWLVEHGGRVGARFVLTVLLTKVDPGPHADAVVATALDWVRRHWRRVDAQYVLTGLLGRVGPGLGTTVAVEHARRWVVAHRARDDARYVLCALLDKRHDLGRAAREVIDLALDWLTDHRGPETAMVLSALLRRTDRAVPGALAWLRRHGTPPTAQYLLEPLLTERALDPAQADEVVRLALLWVLDNPDRFAGGFLLGAVLDGRPLGEHAETAPTVALAWLPRHAAEPVAGNVLLRLVERAEPVVLPEAARTWLDVHHESHTAGPLLAALLPRPGSGALLDHGVAWLVDNRKSTWTNAVAAALLGRPDLGGHTDTVTAHALRRLVVQGDQPAAAGLRTALGVTGSDLDAALAWLDDHAHVPAAEVLLRHLLLCADPGEHADRLVARALEWLTHHGTTPEAGPLLDAVLPRTTGAVVDTALAWLAGHRLPGRSAILRSLLAHPDLGDRRAAAVDLAVARLAEEEDALREPHLPLLKAVLKVPGLDEGAYAAVVRWLDTHDTATGAAQVLSLVVDRDDLGAHAGAVAARALAWVRANPGHATAYVVLSKLLTRPEAGAWTAGAVACACEWAAEHGSTPKGRFVVGRLLERPDLGPLAPVAVAHGLRWLELHGTYPKAWFVLLPLLRVPGRHLGAVTGHARAWLAATDNDPAMRAEVEALLAEAG